MPFNEELIDELNVLMQFSLESMQQGIKVHSDAEHRVKTATRRLYDKGILSQVDGGYLTDLGLEAAELTEKLLGILSSPADVSIN